jgi:hypothetical protein
LNVEGYKELGLEDEIIDDLLSNAEIVSMLRRFRNATFHYQDDPINEKLLAFLEEPESEIWINRLNDGFKNFFLRNWS